MKWIAALALLCACGEPELVPRTQVITALYADAEIAAALQRVEVEIRDEGGLNVVSQHSFATPQFPLSFGVIQPTAGDEWFLLIVRGFGAVPEPLVEYKVIAQFVPSTTGLLSVSLSARCAGVSCEGQTLQSCYAEFGTCVPVTRDKPTLLPADEKPTTPVELEPPSMVAPPVPPSTHGAATLGARRGDGTIMLSRDGFESAERRCTSDRRYCVTGSLMP